MTRLMILIAMMITPLLSHASWWSEDWQFRKQWTVDVSTVQHMADQTVPVLLRVHNGNFGFFTDLKADGSDLRFLAPDDQTLMKYHVEKYDPVLGMALIWVSVPVSSAIQGKASFWMYYGNPNVGSAENAAGTFDANQTMVLHFDQVGGAPKDQTAYENNNIIFNALPQPGSYIGSGVKFDGSNTITVHSTPALYVVPSNGWTFSSWIKPQGPVAESTEQVLLEMREGVNQLILTLTTAGAVGRVVANGEVVAETNAVPVTPATWSHLSYKVEPSRIVLALNGQELGLAPVNTPQMGGIITLGGVEGTSTMFVGEMDEVRFSNVARDAAWLKFNADIASQNSTMVTFGEDEQGKAQEVNYLAETMNNLTHDAEIVILILTIMGIISFIIMIMKGMYLSKTRKANAKFLKAFDQIDLESDAQIPLAALAKSDKEFGASTLFRMYQTAIFQVENRLGHSLSAQATALNLKALNSIRSAMSGTSVRINQKLNSLIVFLTIAISGGPFIGLLGTVIGVMITFAAISAAGDVNINVIAPGIAAALMATVFGLLVAIPALFGYNYLASRIKEINADNGVFGEELLAQINEHHGQD